MEYSDEDSELTDVYLPGDPVPDCEELVRDETTYDIYHEAHAGSPSLSFDILHDELGDARMEFPLSCYVVCGTQTDQKPNHMIVMKMSNLHRTSYLDDESDDEAEENLDNKPELETAMVLHHGGVNRVRATTLGNKNFAATWSERNSVHIWDLSTQLKAVDDAEAKKQFLRIDQKKVLPAFTFSGHLSEGFALDWSSNGSLLTGDCQKNIHLWNPQNFGTWNVDQRPFLAHTDSVEDIQWSPNETCVFASCSVDKTIKVWDTRASPARACMLSVYAHAQDVNVISWNKVEPFIVSGGDDAMIKVWDLRVFQKETPIAAFKHHVKPISSIEWHPTESSVFAASGSDDQLTQWDLAIEPDSSTVVERDGNEDSDTIRRLTDIPPQLLFIHQGQNDIKELHWHPQIPGLIVSTALSGFNVFKTVSV